jgi:protein involved in polysaccharide export with SLBB domain
MRIDGAVNYPGTYDYLQGDSIGTMIKIAGGFSRGADSNRITIKRFVNNIDSLITLTCSLSDTNGASFKLNADDRIIISFFPDYRVFRNVTIKGEVNYPGVYPIQKDKTKLSELIDMAGGLTNDANLKESKIRRKFDTNAGKREYERLKKFPPSQITPLEASYIVARSGDDDGYFSLDLEGVAKKGNEINNFILRNGDEVIINSKNLSVKVIGGVVNPGLVEYKNGADAQYYIKKVGGFSNHANRPLIKIIKSGSEKWHNEKDVKEIVQGDVIWIPEKGYRDYYVISRDVLVILSSLATIIISAFTINNYL